ncbi:unnamed protein product [Thelazia callipaeda]|uniref:Uncharacterized protein n=1 Tax=Thelazia callipaeda TaxID=103827 RepID=A0A0N5CSL1_THECL|nr:unnamed protein product [Thelazia callipaeda]
MKESNVGRIAFGVCVSLAMVFTLISLLTPGNQAWRTFQKRAKHSRLNIPTSIGLLRYQCIEYLNNYAYSKSGVEILKKNFCDYVFNNQASWDKMVLYTLISSFIIELVSIIYLFLPRDFCCERYEYMALPFSIFATCIITLLLYGVISYALRYQEITIIMENFSKKVPPNIFDPSEIKVGLGYSYYLSCIALGFAFLSLSAAIFNITLPWCFLW